jgi:hypothetical protein
LITILIIFDISDKLANFSYLLKDNFLDSSTIIYIYNNSTRFINLKLSKQLLFTGTNIADTQGFRDINIIISTLDGKKYYIYPRILY